jgi:hypothetical protein
MLLKQSSVLFRLHTIKSRACVLTTKRHKLCSVLSLFSEVGFSEPSAPRVGEIAEALRSFYTRHDIFVALCRTGRTVSH